MPKRDEVVADMNKSLFGVVRIYDRFRTNFAREHQLTVSDLRALSRIVERRSMTPKQLATSLDLTTGAVTPLIDRMVDSGYVTRGPHPTDRRSLLLEPTAAGRAMMRELEAAFEDLLRTGIVELDDERLEDFSELLRILVAKGRELNLA